MSAPLYDVALTFDPVELESDLTITDGDLTPERTLRTAILLSLFTDARAPDSLELPDRDRRGWWADAYAEIDGDRFGSLLWTLAREKSLAVVASKAKTFTEQALAWMVSDDIAEKVEATVELLPQVAGQTTRPVLGIRVEAWKPPNRLIAFQFRYVWENL